MVMPAPALAAFGRRLTVTRVPILRSRTMGHRVPSPNGRLRTAAGLNVSADTRSDASLRVATVQFAASIASYGLLTLTVRVKLRFPYRFCDAPVVSSAWALTPPAWVTSAMLITRVGS